MTQDVPLSRYRDELVSFKTGQVIFKRNEPGDVMYLITRGEVEIDIRGKLIERVEPGGVIGEMALLDMGPRSATATAHSDCLLLPINRERFEQQVKKSPQFALKVMKVMAERLRRLDHFI